MDEKYILKKAKKGDRTAFYKLIEGRKERNYRIAYSYTKNKEDALDIVSEATYKAFLSINKLKEPQYFNTWITRILINCAINHVNKSKKILHLDNHNNLVLEEKEVISKEEKMDLYEAIDRLDAKHKTIIILKYIEDLTISDIAKVLEWPEGTVKTYLYRALKSLKIDLEEV